MKTQRANTWSHGLGAALLLLTLAAVPGSRAAGAPALSSHGASVARTAAHLTSWQALPPGLATTGAVSATWSQQAELTSTAQSYSDCFACAVALSGNTVVVGAPDASFPNDYGAAYIFARSGSTWTQQAALTDPGGQPSDMFGLAVAISGNTAAIGAFTSAGGVVYLYGRSGTTWTLQATLTPSDAVYYDGFGGALAISGTILIVGAQGANNQEGAVYVFEGSGNTWTQQAELLYPGHVGYASFGNAVVLSRDTIVAGTLYGGAAYVYVHRGSTWHEQAELRAPPQANGEYFGLAVALSGDTALVSACCANSRATASVAVFGRSGTTWTLLTTIAPPAGASGEEFGSSVGLSEHTAVIGGGPTYVYVGSGSTWREQAELIATGVPPDGPGSGSVALQGNTIVAGDTSAAAYVFVRTAG